MAVTDIARSPDGLVIVHVIPDAWGPFVDIRACYLSQSRRRPWVHVITPDEYRARQNTWLWNDPGTTFVCWDLIDPGPKYLRKSRVVHVYAEALDYNGMKLLPTHLDHWHLFKDMTVHFDAVLTHTPMTAEIVRRVGVTTFVMPVGWDEAAMGSPRVAPKFTGYAYHGSMAGRRNVILPFLHSSLGGLFKDVTGAFGRGLLGQIDVANASLYIAHSEVASFSTWRLWQVASTTAAIVAEAPLGGTADTWPFVGGGQHLVDIPAMTIDSGDAFVANLRNLLSNPAHLAEIASRAHEEVARKYTVDYVCDNYLVPAIFHLSPSNASA